MYRRLTLLLAAALAATPALAQLAQTPRAPAPGSLFISPSGEPFRLREGKPAPFEQWFMRADRNRDGAIVLDEFMADGHRLFVLLDIDGNGELSNLEMARYETDVAPEILHVRPGRGMATRSQPSAALGFQAGAPPGFKMGSRRGKPYKPVVTGAGLFDLLGISQPVRSADADFNNRLTEQEWTAALTRRFQTLDENRDGKLTREELLARAPRPARR